MILKLKLIKVNIEKSKDFALIKSSCGPKPINESFFEVGKFIKEDTYNLKASCFVYLEKYCDALNV